MIVWGNYTPPWKIFELFTCKYWWTIINSVEKNDFTEVTILSFESPNNEIRLKFENLPVYTSKENIYFWESVSLQNEDFIKWKMIGWIKWKLNDRVIHNIYWHPPFVENYCKTNSYYYSTIMIYVVISIILVTTVIYLLYRLKKKK